jgi:D-alanyl-D-alanine carboxypeptidase
MSERLFAYDIKKGTAYIVVDAKTSEILDEKNAYGYKYPASLTKMMTLYVLFTELKISSDAKAISLTNII